MNYKKLYTLPLLLSFLITLSFAEEAPTNVKAWNIKENSVKIAFQDNIANDRGYEIFIYKKESLANSNNIIAGVGFNAEETAGSGKYFIKKLSGLRPGTEYKAIVYGYWGAGQMDNNTPLSSKALHFKTKGEDPSAIYGKPPSDLKAWRIKETSVKISFQDNMDEEEEYNIRIYLNNTNEQVGEGVISKEDSVGTGQSHISKISGLKPGTEYRVAVYAIFAPEGMDSNYIPSRALYFKTKGESVQSPSDIGATDLRTWSIRSTSAMISFRNNDADNSGTFEFTNVDTQETMTLNSKGIITVPNNENYLIGKMIDLTPETTYNIRVSHDEMQESEVITFRTKK